MRYRLARFLQGLALFIIIPLAVAGNLAEVAGSPQALDLKESLMLAVFGIVVFYIGHALQGPSAQS